jgi:beta-glucanase (GH16 family)
MNVKGAAGLLAIIASATMMSGQTAAAGAPPQAVNAGFTKMVLNEDFQNFDIHHPERDSVAWRPLGVSVSERWFSVNDGVLTITTPPSSKHGAVASLTTQGAGTDETHQDFLFGYFEARLRFDWNPDNWDSFWLMSGLVGKPGRSCEIDIMEPQSNDSTYIGTVHDWDSGKRLKMAFSKIQLPRSARFSEWNTFGALWQPGKISWYFNNRLVGSQNTPEICDHDRLNLIVSACKQGGDEDQKLQVKWIHVYQSSADAGGSR